MRTQLRTLALITPIVLAVDQWTKHLIHTKFYWGESLPIIPNYFDLTYVRNSGAAFGLMHRAPEWFRAPFFILIPLIVLTGIFMILIRSKPNDRWAHISLSLVFSGAIGNLIDRLRFGWVIDFLYFHWKQAFYYPAFNVADSCIVVGVCLLFLLSFRKSV